MGIFSKALRSLRSKPAPVAAPNSGPKEAARQFLGGFGRERARREHRMARQVHQQTGRTLYPVEQRFPFNHVRTGEFVICDDQGEPVAGDPESLTLDEVSEWLAAQPLTPA